MPVKTYINRKKASAGTISQVYPHEMITMRDPEDKTGKKRYHIQFNNYVFRTDSEKLQKIIEGSQRFKDKDIVLAKPDSTVEERPGEVKVLKETASTETTSSASKGKG